MKYKKRAPNTVGGGSKTNLNGLSFEGRTNLMESFDNHPKIKVIDLVKDRYYDVTFDNEIIGQYTEKHDFYKYFLEPKGIYWKKINSKKYLPDGVFINALKGVVYVIEKKFQQGSGSVDEKLQTCDFKKEIYSKLISPTGYETEYFYLLNDWFERPEYKDVKEYIESVGCKYFIEEIGLEDLGID
ncbi:MAG: hypothetical protein JXR19_07160 [Bacteroidia bacterium]